MYDPFPVEILEEEKNSWRDLKEKSFVIYLCKKFSLSFPGHVVPTHVEINQIFYFQIMSVIPSSLPT